MAYTLGSITLPTPTDFQKIPIEVSATHLTLDGQTKKDIIKRKWQYILTFDHLTQTEVDNILTEYNYQTVRTFSVSETNLIIAGTSVHVELSTREYLPGPEYRERLQLILTEVS